ncbi:VWA domain-containing protein [Candidatus Woesearchaeota archaeon]|nr:VWA domain-containing protein [Candidatus Woesearchaeota archaeon]
MKEALNKYTQAKVEVDSRRQEVAGLEATLAGQNQSFAATEQELKAAIQQEIDARFASLTEADKALLQNDPVKAYQLLFPDQVVSPGKYRGFAVLLDSSGSMEDFGAFKEASQGAQEAFNFCTGDGAVINFSLETLFSGWTYLLDAYGKNGYRTRNVCAMSFLSDYLRTFQRGGTQLSNKELMQLINQAKEPFYALMVTDGQIENFNKIQDTLKSLKEKGNELEIIYLGSDAKCLKDLTALAKVQSVKPNQVKAKILECARAKLE